MNINQQILQNLLYERELCIVKIQFTTDRLERLEEQIAEQKRIVDKETEENKL